MYDVNALYVRLDEAVHEIERTPSDRHAISSATDVLGRILIAILAELQEQRNA